MVTAISFALAGVACDLAAARGAGGALPARSRWGTVALAGIGAVVAARADS